jgi:hypothetical protein
VGGCLESGYLIQSSQRPRISHERLESAKDTLAGKIGLTRYMVNASTRRLGRGGEKAERRRAKRDGCLTLR